MAQDDTIPFLVETPLEPMKGALDIPAFSDRALKVVEIKAEHLSANIGNLVAKMQDALKSASELANEFELNKVNFSIAVDAKGGVSIFSLAKGQVGAAAAIEVTLERRRRRQKVV